jgi:hypothetical protein
MTGGEFVVAMGTGDGDLRKEMAAVSLWYKTAVMGIRMMLRNTMERIRRFVIGIRAFTCDSVEYALHGSIIKFYRIGTTRWRSEKDDSIARNGE